MTQELIDAPAGGNIEQMQGRIKDLVAEAQGIVDAAAEEGRAVTEAEQDRFNAIMGAPGSEGEGLVCDIQANIRNAQTLAAQQASLQQVVNRELRNQITHQAARMGDFNQALEDSGTGHPMNCTQPVRVPAQCRAYRPLGREWNNPHTGRPDPEMAYAAGRWILAALGHDPSRRWAKDHGMQFIRDQQQIGDPAKGGYLVPTELERVVIDIREQYGVIARDARRRPMASETLDINKVLAGLVAAPAAENADLEAGNLTEKTWAQHTLVAKKWATWTPMSSEINEDAVIDMASDLAMDIGRAFAFAEDDACFNGDGTGTYNDVTGVKNALAAGSTLVTAGTTFAAITQEEFNTLQGMLPNVAGMQPMWYIHKTAYAASMLGLLTAAGGNTISTLEQGAAIQRGDADFFFNGSPGRWLNVGVKTSDEAVNVKGAVYYGDLSMGVSFGLRRGASIALSEHARFALDQIVIRGTTRWDAYVHERGDATNCGVIAQMQFAAA